MSTPDPSELGPAPDPAGATAPEVVFTPKMDEQILRGLVEDEVALLREMSASGHSASVVRARATHLGLTQQIVLRCRLSNSWPSMRVCLACELRFLSMGSHHRLCKRCQPQR